MTLKCLIIEDQAPARRLLEDYADRHPDLLVIGATALASIGREILDKETVDLLFLDLSLPQADGFAFLNALSAPPVTIITTAFPNRAVEGFDAGVADYLVKPISYARFETAVARADQMMGARTGNMTVDIPLSRSDIRRVNLQDIQWLSADGDYVVIHTVHGQLHVSGPLTNWQERLKHPDFVRIHRSHIVNMYYVTRRAARLVYIGDVQLPVGRKFLPHLDGR